MPFITRFLASQARSLPTLPDVRLEGKVYIITGANSGIGLEVAKHLVERGASRLIFAVRDVSRGQNARKEVFLSKPKNHQVEIEVWELDLASNGSVTRFAEKCEDLDRVDGVAMNAGILGGDQFDRTVDGHELVAQVNILSPIYLATLLAPVLERSTQQSGVRGRIVFTGSAVAEVASTKGLSPESPLAGLDDEKLYRAGDRYNQSKLILHLLVRRLIAAYPQLIITDVNPGFVTTPLYRDTSGPAATMVKLIGRTPEVGARNVSFALLTLDSSTDWFHDCRPCKIHHDWLNSPAGIIYGENLWKEVTRGRESSS